MSFLKNWFSAKCASPDTSLNGKTVIVTGANTGIGKETARDFVKRGGRVILACRNLEKANQAAEEIRSAGPGEPVVRRLDLASFKSIQEFAKETIEKEERIDILVNNAGLLGPKGKTEDGFDLTFGTNHLGPFLLTNLLLDKIKQSAPSRIINLSSTVHYSGDVDWDDINLDKPGNYSPVKAYGQSKLCNILFTTELARKLEGTEVNVYALNPGFIKTEVFRDSPVYYRPIIALFAKDVGKGAQTTVYCATSDQLKTKSGLYYNSDCAETKPSAKALDETSAKKLWELSIKMCGLEEKQ